MKILDWLINENEAKRLGLPDVLHMMGRIPEWVLPDDPRPAWEQLNERYVWGGWQPLLPARDMTINQDFYFLFPGDPPLAPLACAKLRDETIIIYPHCFVAIMQANGDFSIARLD